MTPEFRQNELRFDANCIQQADLGVRRACAQRPVDSFQRNKRKGRCPALILQLSHRMYLPESLTIFCVRDRHVTVAQIGKNPGLKLATGNLMSLFKIAHITLTHNNSIVCRARDDILEILTRSSWLAPRLRQQLQERRGLTVALSSPPKITFGELWLP